MTNSIKFTKMQGLGNDFVLVDNEEFKKSGLSYAELAKKMCDRNFGIGADGLIIVNPSDMKADTDTCWRIINSDGSEPQMCGNGIRCFAKYVFNKNIVNKKKFTVNTLAGVITPEILDNGQVRVDMGAPILEARKVPTSVGSDETLLNYEVEANGRKFKINAISMGNPHCIIFTNEDSEKLAKEYGPYLEVHELFPEKTNVEFVQVLSKNHVKIDVWERGCGITLACGTGSCATVVAAILNNLTENSVDADLPGGRLNIEWQGDKNSSVYMNGNAEYVFSGEYLL